MRLGHLAEMGHQAVPSSLAFQTRKPSVPSESFNFQRAWELGNIKYSKKASCRSKFEHLAHKLAADNVVPAIPQAVLAAPSTSVWNILSIDVVTPELTPAQRLFFSIPSATDLSVERRDALLKDVRERTLELRFRVKLQDLASRPTARQPNTHLKPQLTAEEAYLLDLKEAEDYIDVTSRMGDHRPLAPLQGVDCTGRRLFFWVPNAVSALAPGITSTVEKFVEKYPPVKSAKDNRHVNWDLQPTHNGVYHLGVWQPTGGAPGGDIGTSAETFPGSSGKADAVVEFLRHQHILDLAETVQALFRRLDPDMEGRYSAAMGRLNPSGKLLWDNHTNKTFAMLVVVLNQWIVRHRDLKDIPDGGVRWRTVLPDLGVKIPFKSGDILFIRSCALEHMLEKWGTSPREFRVCLVFKMHKGVFLNTEENT
ncbi:hypothetical protein BJ742DRAFT_742290 [Cladochytrium replicatum]|nr:hypothetical protein BJ742DRAFT_742290 [Cladochytrium replicatum]